MKSKLQTSINSKTTWAFLSIGCIICGIVFLFIPKISVYGFCLAAGTTLFIAGALILTLFFLKKRYLNQNSYQFLTGVFLLIFGLYIAINTDEAARMLTILFATIILFDSVIKMLFSFTLLKSNNKQYKIFFILGLLTMALAAIIMIDPFFSDDFRNSFTYWSLLINGILSLILIFMTNRISKSKSLVKSEQQEL